MLNATPVLKIVDSAEYRVEITTNSDVFDKLKIATADDTVGSVLVITFTDDCYVPVHVDDVEYDFDAGLYVDFDKFEVTVYAPISTLFVDSKIILDYQAPKCNRMYVDFSYEGTDANIYDIDTDELILCCSGTSNITLSGAVRYQSKISIWHNTKVDANNLKMNSKSFYVSSSILGYFSYIKYNNTFDIGLSSNVFSFMLNAFLCLPPILWTVCLIICLRKKSVLARK